MLFSGGTWEDWDESFFVYVEKLFIPVKGNNLFYQLHQQHETLIGLKSQV